MQQTIALAIIAFMLGRLVWQKRRQAVAANEFFLWLVFWLLAALAVVFLRRIDALLAGLGFSGAGIDILLYLGVILLFYLAGKSRIRQEKTDREITKIVRHIGLDSVDKDNK